MNLALSVLVLGLAWFAAVNLVASAAVWALARRLAPDVAPSAVRSRRLLAVRFLPFVVATIVSAAIFIPAHVKLEPAQTEERYGFTLLAFTCAGLVLLLGSCYRGVRVLLASRRLSGLIERQVANRGDGFIESPVLHGVALAGLFRPRVLVGSDARHALTPEELDLAVAHEMAHHHARDNPARVLMLCVPDFFGCTRASRRIERIWNDQAECLADARAANGSEERAALLASALVKVARLRTPDMPSVAWSLFHQPPLIETRVRLLVEAGPVKVPRRGGGAMFPALAVTLIASTWATSLPARLHAWTEIAVALLP